MNVAHGLHQTVKYASLLAELLDKVTQTKDVSLLHVRAHAGNRGNEMADFHANSAREQQLDLLVCDADMKLSSTCMSLRFLRRCISPPA